MLMVTYCRMSRRTSERFRLGLIVDDFHRLNIRLNTHHNTHLNTDLAHWSRATSGGGMDVWDDNGVAVGKKGTKAITGDRWRASRLTLLPYLGTIAL